MADGSANVAPATPSLIARRPRARRSPLTSPRVRRDCTRTFDAAAILSLGWITYGVRNDWRMLDDASLIALFVGVLLGPQLFGALGVYAERWVGRPALLLPRLIGAWAATIAGVVVVMFMLKSGESISRLWIGSWAVSGAVALVLARLFIDAWVARARRAGAFVTDVLVVGGSARLAERAAAAIAGDQAMRIVATSLFRSGEEAADLSSLRRALRADPVHLVVLALNDDERLNVAALLEELKQFPCDTCLVAPALDESLPVCGVLNLGRLPAVTLLKTPIDGWHRVLKEIEDRVVAALLLILVAPSWPSWRSASS
jgi:hypothetical protein